MWSSLLLAAVAAASAVAPTATTGAPTRTTQVSARLNGSVNPKGQQTSYSFDYGPSTSYGTNTGAVSAGAGTTTVHASADLGGLQPATTYHFRIVAANASGTTAGSDRTFTTHGAALQYGLHAGAPAIVYGTPVVLSGTLKGQNSAGRELVLQGRRSPYHGSFAIVAGPVTSSSSGAYSFRLAALAASTQFRVAPTDGLAGPSREQTITVAPKITTRMSTGHPRRGEVVLFSGAVRPAHDGSRFAIQRLAGRRWVTIAGGVTRHAHGGVSTYAKRVRITRGGEYRVFVQIVGGDETPAGGRPKRVRLR